MRHLDRTTYPHFTRSPKPLPLRNKVSYAKRMTLAAGFLGSDGLLLCADMLVSDGYTKQYDNKLYVWSGNGISVCFGIAGNAGMAKMVAENCSMALHALDWDRQSFAEVYGVLATSVKYVQQEYVDNVPAEERERSRFYMLIGIYTANSGHRLYSTNDATISPVLQGFECIGSAKPIGMYILEPSYRRSLSVNQLSLIAMHALAAAKGRCEGVGGRSQFVALKEGVVSSIGEFDSGNHEKDVLEYRQACYKLLGDIHNREVDKDSFEKSLAAFADDARFLKAKWTGPTETFQAFKEWIAKLEATLNLQPTIGESLPLPPLRE